MAKKNSKTKARKRSRPRAAERPSSAPKRMKARSRGGAPEPGVPGLGTVGWVDLTTASAPELRDFYSAVVGWSSDAVDMGGYNDFCMFAPGSEQPVAGVCESRGVNEGLPRCWLVYFMVADVAKAVAEAERRGARVVRPAGPMGPMGRFAVIEDPLGAACALFERAS